MRPTGAVLLGLYQRDIRSEARGFLREVGAEYPSVRDPEDDTARSWGATGIPETYFLDAKGRVVAHVPGPIDAGQLRRGARRGPGGSRDASAAQRWAQEERGLGAKPGDR